MVICIFENHENNEIIAVCSNPGCIKRRLVCFQCIIDFHNDHNKDLKQMAKLISWKSTLMQAYTAIQNHYNMVQQYLKLLQGFISISEFDRNQSFENLNYHQMEDDINSLLCFDQFQENISNISNEITKNIISLTPIFKSAVQIFSSIKQETVQIEAKSSTQLKISFSNQMKHEDIIIENDGKSARSISQKYYQNNFVVCEPLIPKKGSYSFSFKIGGWVMIGVCDIEKIKQQKFIVTLDEIPQIHCYMIENDGTSYSSFENQEKRQKSFTYSEYDIIQVLIDFELKIIKWIKPQTKESFQMKINPSTSNLFPCLALGQAWVEVINQ